MPDMFLGECLQRVGTIREVVRKTTSQDDNLRQFAQLVCTTQPVLEELFGSIGNGVDAMESAVRFLLDWLEKAANIATAMSSMGKLEKLLWQHLHREDMKVISRGLSGSIAALKLLCGDIPPATATMLQQAAHNLSRWEPVVNERLNRILELTNQYGEEMCFRNDEVMDVAGKIVEALHMGIPQLLKDIQACLGKDGVPEAQLRVLRLLQRVCTDTQEALRTLWRDPSELELKEVLGKGASGEVYQALDKSKRCNVAVKLALSEMPVPAAEGLSWVLESDDPHVVAMRRELCIIARAHEFDHVCSYLGVSVLRSKPAIIMKYYERGSLAGEIERLYPLGMQVEQALRFSRDILCGLDQLHSAGILVLDVKPANLLLTPQGRLVLADFGLARGLMGSSLKTMTRIQGTPEYMAPEHMVGDRGVSAKADIWAFGATLVHMLSGSAPFSGMTGWQIMHHVVNLGKPPPYPSRVVPGSGLAHLLQRCFAREPEVRPSAAEALKLVEQLMSGGAHSAQATPRSPGITSVDELLQCPLCRNILDDPVMLVDSGITFCRACISAWLDKGAHTCPATGKALDSTATATNHALQSLASKLRNGSSTASSSAAFSVEPGSYGMGTGPRSNYSESYSQAGYSHSHAPAHPHGPSNVNTQMSLPQTPTFTIASSAGAEPISQVSLASAASAVSRKSGSVQSMTLQHGQEEEPPPQQPQPQPQTPEPQQQHQQRQAAVSPEPAGPVTPLPGTPPPAEDPAGMRGLQEAVVLCSGANPHIGLRQVVEVLGSRCPAVQQQAATVLCQLSEGNPAMKVNIATAGAMDPLVRLLHSSSAAVQQEAARAVACLCSGHRVSQDGLAAAGAVQHLVPLLRSPVPAVQQQAALALQEMCTAHEGNKRSIAAAGQAVDTLVGLLRSQGPAAPAASLLACLCVGERSNQQQVAAAGAFESLVAMLGPGGAGVHEAAALLCALVADNSSNKDRACEAGAVEQLASLLQSHSAAEQEAASRAVADLVVDHISSKRTAAAAGAIPSLVKLLQAREHRVQHNAARCLQHLASGVRANQDAMASAGAIAPLVRLLDATHQLSVQKRAALALAALASDHQRVQTSVAAAGALAQLAKLLRCTEPSVQAAAAKGIACLCQDHGVNKHTVTEGGGVELLMPLLGSSLPAAQQWAAHALAVLTAGRSSTRAPASAAIKQLVKLLASEHAGVQEAATAALAATALVHGRYRESIAAAGAVPQLVRLLHVSNAAAVQQEAAHLLALLASGRAYRKSIAAAGAIKPLVKLLSSPSQGVQQQAAQAIACVSADQQGKVQDQVAAAGAVVPLLQLLDSGAPPVQEAACHAIATMAQEHGSNQDRLGEAGAMEQLVPLLASASPAVQERAAQALAALTDDHEQNRRLVLAAGAADQLMALSNSAVPCLNKAAANVLANFSRAELFGSRSYNSSLSVDKDEKCSIM